MHYRRRFSTFSGVKISLIFSLYAIRGGGLHKPRFTMKTLQYSTLRRWILLWKTKMLNSSPVSATRKS